jgi:hypothetical protein
MSYMLSYYHWSLHFIEQVMRLCAAGLAVVARLRNNLASIGQAIHVLQFFPFSQRNKNYKDLHGRSVYFSALQILEKA